MNLCDKTQELISGYIDHELTQQEAQRVRLHINDCGNCAKVYKDLLAIKEQMGQLKYPECEEAKLDKWMNEPVAKNFAVIGWACLIVGLLGFMLVQLFTFYTQPDIPLGLKALVLLIEIGFLGLFISVLRQRLIARKTDKYRNVKL